MYQPGDGAPTDEELAALGLTRDDIASGDDAIVWIYADAAQAVELFGAMGTQWRMGFGGPVGLDYAALPAVMDMHGIQTDDRRPIFDDIRVMERAALEVMHERSKAK